MKHTSFHQSLGEWKKKAMRYYPIPIQMAIIQKEEEEEEKD